MNRLLPIVVLVLAGCAGKPPAPPPRVEAPAAPPAPAFAAPAPPRVDPTALLSEARALRGAGDEAGARDRLDAALAADSTLALARLERAEVRLALGDDPALVLEDARGAQTLVDNPRARRVLGQALEETGDPAGALAAYQASLALRDDASLRRRVAALLAREGQLDHAAAEWEALRDASPEDVAVHLELATLYERLSRPASAEKELATAVGLAPTNALLLRRLADLYTREGKPREARAARARADALDPPPADRRLRPLQPSKR